MTIKNETLNRHPKPNDPKWLKTAFQELGVCEIVGGQHQRRIIEYHACTGLGATSDETPWCSSFLCWVMNHCAIVPTGSAASLSWLRWGHELREPKRGCVVVFERVGRNGQVIPNRGHVALWLGQNDNIVWCLGGNQKNQVGVNAYRRDRVIGYRWPTRPTNSTTNIAAVTSVAATSTVAAPTVMTIIEELKSPTVQAGASELATMLGIAPQNAIAMVGLGVAIVAAGYVIRERNKKIRNYGI